MKKLFVAGLISQVLLLLSQPVGADQVPGSPYPGSAGATSSYGSTGTPSAAAPNYNAAPAPYYQTSNYGAAPAGYTDPSAPGYSPGAPVAYYGFAPTNGYQPGPPAGFASVPPAQYQNGAPGYGNAAPAGYANGAPAGYGAATGYGNGSPTGYGNAAPSSYGNASPTGYGNGTQSGYGNASPAGYGSAIPAPFGTSAGTMPGQSAGTQPFPPSASAGLPAAPVPGQSLSQQAGQYPQYPQAGMIPTQPGQGQPGPATLLQQQNGMQQYGLPAQNMLPSQSAAVRGMATPPSAIESTMTQDPVPADKTLPQQFNVGPLTQFGYSFFRPDAAGFAPLGDVPVGPDYQVGPGDHLTVTLWGSIEGTFDLEVNRSGELVLPKVGVVQVTGETLGQLPGLLKSQLGRVFKDFHINVNMGRLRMMKVYVVGQVTAPGDYNLTSLSTLINALSAAGGPTKDGSLRNVQIKIGRAHV
jgi:protein involved in polysaccharide export with SLBB domain